MTAVAALLRAMPVSWLSVRCGIRMPVVVKYTAMKPQVALPRVRVSAIERRRERGISSSSSTSSASGTQPAWVSGSITVNASHPSHRLLADLDRDLHALRQVDVDTRAEADQTDAVALLDLRALRDVGDDAAGHRAGDLDHLDVTEFGVEVPDDALVVLALLVETGTKPPGMCSTEVTVPESGARLTWTLSGLMKIATRVRPSFHGMMLCTTPSAGEMTRPWAISRSGSRKNHSMPAPRAGVGTATAAQRPERRGRARLPPPGATVGGGHGEA